VFATQSKTIDGIDVKVTPFPAGEAIRIQALLLRLVGPAIGRAVGAVDNVIGAAKLGELKIDGNGLAGAIAELADKWPEDQLMEVLKRLLRGVQCVVPDPLEGGRSIAADFGDPKTFDNSLDLVFQGRTMSVYSVVAYVLQVNYPDFFQKVLGTGGLLGGIFSSKKAGSADASSSSGSAGSAASGQS